MVTEMANFDAFGRPWIYIRKRAWNATEWLKIASGAFWPFGYAISDVRRRDFVVFTKLAANVIS